MSSYLVVFICPSHSVLTATARFKIEEGVYTYVGSCGVSCTKRVLRHLTRPRRRKWHVDCLQCRAAYAAVIPVSERHVAQLLASRCPYVPQFGSTDDPAAPSHLFKCDVDYTLHLIGLTT